jgi:Ni/Fe-hydrogenase subunit HybB-like protein
MSDVARPLGGRIFTPGFVVLLALAGVSGVLILVRVFGGVGSITAMTDGYPWGIWKPLNVVTFTGVAAGAYGIGLLCYVLNRGKYHPLVRPAVLVGALGYSLAGFSVLVDLGRWWNAWKLGEFWYFNLNSVLLEVAICVLTYVGVLWVEVTPAILESWQSSRSSRLRRVAAKGLPFMKKAFPFIIALAILLPTMHQSSLGSLYLVAIYKLHPLWLTPLLPLLFLLSCLTMGYGGVIIMDTLLAVAYPTYRRDVKLSASVSKVAAAMLWVYVAIRVADLAWHSRLGLLFTSGWKSFFFWLEIALFVIPALLLGNPHRRRDPGILFRAALLTVMGGSLYRFDTYLVGYDPGPGWSYFPSVNELLVSIGLASAGIAVFVFAAKKFPILSAGPAHGVRKPAQSTP